MLDVARIVNTQSQVIPTGEIRIGPPDKGQTYYVSSNSMIGDPKDFEKIPLFNDGRKIVRLKDVAEVVDGTRWRTNVVRVDGRKAVYMPLLRQAGLAETRLGQQFRRLFVGQLSQVGLGLGVEENCLGRRHESREPLFQIIFRQV